MSLALHFFWLIFLLISRIFPPFSLRNLFSCILYLILFSLPTNFLNDYFRFYYFSQFLHSIAWSPIFQEITLTHSLPRKQALRQLSTPILSLLCPRSPSTERPTPPTVSLYPFSPSLQPTNMPISPRRTGILP